MWKPVHDPGPWSQFLKRKDIIGLPLKEAKRKFLKEQLDYDNFITYQQLALKGISPKGPKAPTELVSIPVFEGLLRYADFDANTCTNPAIDVFIQDFGPEYISTDLSSPVFATNTGSDWAIQLNFTEALRPLNWIRFIYTSYNATTSNPPYVTGTGPFYPYVTLLEEFQGRPNVLKVTKPPQFAGGTSLSLKVEMETFVDDPSYYRPNYWDTHTWSYGIGVWSENPSVGVSNYTFNGGGSADLLIGLSTYPTPSAFMEKFDDYNANEWVDIRTLNKPIVQGNSEGETWVNILNLFQGPIATDNPDAIAGIGTYEENIYISDWNFRVCPI